MIAPGMYKMNTRIIQPKTPQLPQEIKKTNKRVSFSTGVIPTTSVSRPQLKSNQLEDRVLHNNSQGKKQQVEDHHMKFKFSNNKTSVTASHRDNSIHRRLWVLKAHDEKSQASKKDEFGVELGLKVLEEEVVPKVDDVSLVDGVFDGAFGGDGEKNFVMGEGVVVSSSSLDMFTKSCLGGMIVSLIFLEGLEE
ncbi:hypothetical protein Tco_0602495 [Tanacetum coccineum]